MDEGNQRPGYAKGAARDPHDGASARPNPPLGGAPISPTGGLLSRFTDDGSGEGSSGGPQAPLESTDNSRVPRAGEWRASDFDSRTLERWDRKGSAPFVVPPDPDAPVAAPRSGGLGTARRPASARDAVGGRSRHASDDTWDGGSETGTWDTGWATDYQPSVAGGARGATAADEAYVRSENQSALSQSLTTLAQLGAAGASLGRIERVRLLLRQRPAAGGMLAFFLLGFILTCCAPMLPVLRLGFDAADAARRVNTLQQLLGGGSSALFNPAKLKQAQSEVDGISHDLYEINGAASIAGAPLATLSPSLANARLLTRMGFDLTAAADEGLQVAQTVLTPLQGGALSADATTPGLTASDLAQARALLNDATVRLEDAVAAYHGLDLKSLPPQLQPGTKYGRLLALLPTAPALLGEVNTLLDSAPALLGIGAPAYYLVVAMDRSELRPSGGFMGNYGVLGIENGKQSVAHPLSLADAYTIDRGYVAANHPGAVKPCDTSPAAGYIPQPPLQYWWWPYRYSPGDGSSTDSCEIAWGLRDSGLSADFPTNARLAMQIVRDVPAQVPNNAPLQGMIAFTPVLIAELLKVTGPIELPTWKTTVTPDNLEVQIHEHQLGSLQPKGSDRKTFTHDLAATLLARIKSLHGDGLKQVLGVAEKGLKSKELQVYFSDPHAELLLQQLGLAAEIHTGGGDGFFVVDTNDGGNKANTFVKETQTDYVTLLPDGGALHQLQVIVSYDKQGSVYNLDNPIEDYADIQRTYLPSDARILGYAGYNPADAFGNRRCRSSAFVTDCSENQLHNLNGTITTSDVPGRAMVMGALTVFCGHNASGTVEQTIADINALTSEERANCDTHPVHRTQTIYIEWYTPHAFQRDAAGHGTYSMLVEKQAGGNSTLTVYVDNQTNASKSGSNAVLVSNAASYQLLINGKSAVVSNQPLDSNTTVTFGF